MLYAFQYHNTERSINTFLFKFGGKYYFLLYSICAMNFCVKATGFFGVIKVGIFIHVLLFDKGKLGILSFGRKSFCESFKS